jgi:glycosyltransferase involved in cell wall biosynthesis
MLPRITIVTPCYNSERFLEETILSVLDQGWENLEYIIVDGGSTDETVDIIRKYEKHLAAWISEPDQGMYDAINKGFAMATGDIYAWMNSDDTYLPGAFHMIAEVFQRYPEMDWLSGSTTYTDEEGATVSKYPLLMYHQDDLIKGYHGLCMHYVQQNCCFWRSSLWEEFGPMPAELRYAGDYWLWTQFAKKSALISVNQPMASFRRHATQLSQDQSKYREEVWQCFNAARAMVLFRQLLRRISRRADLDIRFLNRVRRLPAYRWIDPANDFVIRKTRKTRAMVAKG